MTKERIRFTYGTDSVGMVRELVNWKESAKYIQGVDLSDHRVKTFRKDRVREYLDSAETWLQDPRPEPALFQPKRDRAQDLRPHIDFTGYAKVQRAALEARATDAGMQYKDSVTKSCMYLVAGPNAGPSKLEKARQQSAYILSETQFHALLLTGELPDNPDDDGSVIDC